jgi:hypothetical protein
MLKDDVIYHLGRIEKMRQKIERKIQTLILDNADDAREGFRIIGEDADRLEGEAVALTEIAEEAGFFESDPASSREAFETIALEADSIESTARDVAGMLEEMEGEEGDEVQEVVDDYLGQIDQDHDEIYRAIKKIKRSLGASARGGRRR